MSVFAAFTVKYLIRQWIEALHQNSQCPRLMVDATVAGVDVPDHVREQWGEAMPIDLDPAYPLELEMTDRGIDCVLSFGGPYGCHFPWSAIYVVQDRDSQLGIVIEENLPPRLSLPSDDDADDGPTDAVAFADREEPAPTAALALALVDDPTPPPSGDDESEAPSARRAAFRVIDGGKD